jgi:hypothetical protein
VILVCSCCSFHSLLLSSHLFIQTTTTTTTAYTLLVAKPREKYFIVPALLNGQDGASYGITVLSDHSVNLCPTEVRITAASAKSEDKILVSAEPTPDLNTTLPPPGIFSRKHHLLNTTTMKVLPSLTFSFSSSFCLSCSLSLPFGILLPHLLRELPFLSFFLLLLCYFFLTGRVVKHKEDLWRVRESLFLESEFTVYPDCKQSRFSDHFSETTTRR